MAKASLSTEQRSTLSG